MASVHYDIVVKIVEVTKLDSSQKYINGRHEDVPGERHVADLVSLAVKATSKKSAIDKVKALLDVEISNEVQE
jgi:ketopantoate reductase